MVVHAATSHVKAPPTILVLDAKDAFWQIPLSARKKRFYCGVLRRPGGKTSYLAYTRTPQGSRGAPLSWTAVFGLINRCALSALREPGSPNGQRLQVYVDDPLMVVRGPPAHRRKQVTRRAFRQCQPRRDPSQANPGSKIRRHLPEYGEHFWRSR